MKKLFLFIVLIGFYSPSVFASPAIQFWQTSNGAKVYFVENHDLPILDISVEFGAGSSTDSPEKSGRAGLTQHLLNRGSDKLSEDQITNALADIGAQLGGNFGRDRAGLTLRTLSSTRERDQALDIFSQVIQQPKFPQAILEREQARMIEGLKEASTKPSYIAGRSLMTMLYGDHPYGFNDSGEIDTVSKLQRDDLVQFYKAYYTAENAVIAIIGDVKKSEAAAIAESLTDQLPRKGKTSLVDPVKTPQAQIKRIVHPATQSHIQLAYPGLKRSDPDYFPLLVGNYILGGGGFVSRLVEEIRQKRGLAYSVQSFFAPYQEQGPFQIGLQTKKEQSEQALAITQQVLKDFVAEGPTADELTAAKQNIIGGFPLRLDSNKKILGYLSMIGFYGLPLTYVDDYLAAVEAVTATQIKQAFQRRINPDGMVTVIVGAIEESSN